MINKKVVMLHGWTDGDISDMPEFLPDNEANWIGWTKNELEKCGYTVTNPFIRYGYKSEYKDWKREIDKIDIDENTVLVGWSAGGAFFTRWLGETKKHVKKLILVAPAKILGVSKDALSKVGWFNEDVIHNPQSNFEKFLHFKLDPEIKNRVDEIVVFVSNDDEWLVESARLYAKELDARLIEIKNQVHFLNHQRPEPKFPEMLKEIMR